MNIPLRHGVAAIAAATLLLIGCGADEPLTEVTGGAPKPEPVTIAEPTVEPTTVAEPTVEPVPPTVPEVADPERIIIEAIDLDASLVELGLAEDGSMETPAFDSNLAGWYIEGPKPGAPGPAVIAAHVDKPGGGPDTFARLDELDAGDEIVVIDSEGVEYEFVVDRSELADKDELPYEEIWPTTDETLLTLITCDGSYVDGEYEDNLIVYATI